MAKTQKIASKILSKIKILPIIDVSWCSHMIIENEKFNYISILAELNDFNFITNINILFHAKDPPGYVYVGKIKVSDFKTKEELISLIRKEIKLANANITDAILRAAQLELF